MELQAVETSHELDFAIEFSLTQFPMLEVPENVCKRLPNAYKHSPVFVEARAGPLWLPGTLDGHLGSYMGS